MTLPDLVDSLVEGITMRLPKGATADDVDSALQGLMPGGMIARKAAKGAATLLGRARKVFRVDAEPVKKFKPRKYYSNKKGTESGADNFPGSTKRVQRTYALGSEKEATLYMAPRNVPRARITKPDGTTHTMFNQSDRAAISSHRPTLSELPRRAFRRLKKGGELFTGKTTKPTKQTVVADPVATMKKHGNVGFVKDVGATAKKLRARGYNVSGENLPENMTLSDLVDSLIANVDEVSHQKLARRIAGEYNLGQIAQGVQQPAWRGDGRGARRKVSRSEKPLTKRTPGTPFAASRKRRIGQTEGNCLKISVDLARKYGGRPSHPHGVFTPGENPSQQENEDRVTKHARNLYSQHRDRMRAVDDIKSITDSRQMEKHLRRNAGNLGHHFNPPGVRGASASKDDVANHLISVLGSPAHREALDTPEARVRHVHREAKRLAQEAGSLSYPRHSKSPVGAPTKSTHNGHYITVRAGSDFATPSLHVAFEHRKNGEFNYGGHGEGQPIIGRIPLHPTS